MTEIKNEIIIVNEETIKDKIYTIRGQKIMINELCSRGLEIVLFNFVLLDYIVL